MSGYWWYRWHCQQNSRLWCLQIHRQSQDNLQQSLIISWCLRFIIHHNYSSIYPWQDNCCEKGPNPRHQWPKLSSTTYQTLPILLLQLSDKWIFKWQLDTKRKSRSCLCWMSDKWRAKVRFNNLQDHFRFQHKSKRLHRMYGHFWPVQRKRNSSRRHCIPERKVQRCHMLNFQHLAVKRMGELLQKENWHSWSCLNSRYHCQDKRWCSRKCRSILYPSQGQSWRKLFLNRQFSIRSFERSELQSIRGGC